MRFKTIGAALLLACSTDTFTGGDDDSGGTNDGSTDATSLNDVGVSGDAGAGTRFCQTQDQLLDIFCMDFDDVGLTTAFEKGSKVTISPPQTSNGSATHGSDGVNLTGDADFSTTQLAQGDMQANAYYYLPLGSKAPAVTTTAGVTSLRFSAYVDSAAFPDAANGGGQGAFITLGFIVVTDTTNSSSSIVGAVGMTVSGHLVISLQTQTTMVQLPTLNTWHDYILTMSLASGTNTASLGIKVDGVSAGSLQASTPIPTTATGDFMVGLQSEAPIGAVTTRLDNVSFNTL
jgi:hypothetical protein